FLESEAVLPEQVLGLVEPPLTGRGCWPEGFHRRALNRLEGAEVRVVEQAATLEAAHHAQDLAVPFALRAHHELRGGPRRRDPLAAFDACLARQAAGQHEVRQEIPRVVLLACQAS